MNSFYQSSYPAVRTQTAVYVDPEKIKPIAKRKVNDFQERINHLAASLREDAGPLFKKAVPVVAAGAIAMNMVRLYLENLYLKDVVHYSQNTNRQTRQMIDEAESTLEMIDSVLGEIKLGQTIDPETHLNLRKLSIFTGKLLGIIGDYS